MIPLVDVFEKGWSSAFTGTHRYAFADSRNRLSAGLQKQVTARKSSGDRAPYGTIDLRCSFEMGASGDTDLSLEPIGVPSSGHRWTSELPPSLQNVPSPSAAGAASPAAAVRREAILKARSQRLLLRQLNERRAAESGAPVPVQLDYATVFNYALQRRRRTEQNTDGGDLTTLQVLQRLDKEQGRRAAPKKRR